MIFYAQDGSVEIVVEDPDYGLVIVDRMSREEYEALEDEE